MNKHVYIYSSNTKKVDSWCWDNNPKTLARMLADSQMTHILNMILSSSVCVILSEGAVVGRELQRWQITTCRLQTTNWHACDMLYNSSRETAPPRSHALEPRRQIGSGVDANPDKVLHAVRRVSWGDRRPSFLRGSALESVDWWSCGVKWWCKVRRPVMAPRGRQEALWWNGLDDKVGSIKELQQLQLSLQMMQQEP